MMNENFVWGRAQLNDNGSDSNLIKTFIVVKPSVRHDIFAHNIAIKRYCDKKILR